jgi:signal transduction histidine kinase
MMQLSLKNRVYLLNAILLFITLIGAAMMVWYTYKTETIFTGIIHRNIAVYQAAEGLATSLVNQKGFVSYYLLDKNPGWLSELQKYRGFFKNNLGQVKSLVQEDWEKKAIDRIERGYTEYLTAKDTVIDLYIAGEFEKGFALHKAVRDHFSDILELCEQFKTFHKDKISSAIKESRRESYRLRYTALIAVVTVIFLSLLVNYIFARHIMGPIRKLAVEADMQGGPPASGNEVTALEHSIHGLIENAEQAHLELKKSQETLMQSEKMALLGKLAAGTAHSIRNPLTSVKMRLFSLYRSCSFTETQQEDFTVISDEIQQINKIVENFLEFARPPKLTTKMMSPSLVVDAAFHLLEQRLKSYHVETQLIRKQVLPQTLIDPEQLKEAIVNIIINACEAIEKDGRIIVSEETLFVEPLKKVAVIRIMDNGPGISADAQKEIFNPFFTTKEDGTGLGLSIAFNIISEHGGWLDVSSRENQGADFIITLPVKES